MVRMRAEVEESEEPVSWGIVGREGCVEEIMIELRGEAN